MKEVKKEELEWETQGDMKIPKGKKVVIDNKGWFSLVNKEDEPNFNIRNELNRYCYFCDFSELTPHQHHIIRRVDGGKDSTNNILPLCPNHHELIHKRRYYLVYSRGLYYLKQFKGCSIIKPHERQIAFLRPLPKSSLLNNNYLDINGDIESKAEVRINDMEAKKRKKLNKIIKKNMAILWKK